MAEPYSNKPVPASPAYPLTEAKVGTLRPAQDLTGERFGALTVARFTGAVDARGLRSWECVCDCGATAIFKTSTLRRWSRSCGCALRRAPIRKEDVSEERFWSHTVRDGQCLRWVGCVEVTGYGTVNTRRGSRRAHRVAYAIRHGETPTTMHVCHSCDNPWCVNPDHLFAGTNATNSRDAREKGRTTKGRLRGTSNHKAKLTEESVALIRGSLSRIPARKVADVFGVSASAVRFIRLGRTWSHVPPNNSPSCLACARARREGKPWGCQVHVAEDVLP